MKNVWMNRICEWMRQWGEQCCLFLPFFRVIVLVFFNLYLYGHEKVVSLKCGLLLV